MRKKSPKIRKIDGMWSPNSIFPNSDHPSAYYSPSNTSPSPNFVSPVGNSPVIEPTDGTYEYLFKQVFDYLKENWVAGKIISITKESDNVDNYLYKIEDEDENRKIYKNVKRNDVRDQWGSIGGSEDEQILYRKANLKPKMTKTQSNMFDIVLRTLKKVSDGITFGDSIDIKPGLLTSLKSLKEKDINNKETVTNNYSEGSKKRMTIPITKSKTSMSAKVFDEKYKEIKNEVLRLYKIIKDNETENGQIPCPINHFFSLAKVGRSDLKDDYLTTIYNDYYSNPEKRKMVNDNAFQINESGEAYILPLQLLRTNQFTSETAKAVREKTYEISKEGERYKEYEKKIFDSILSFLQGKDDTLMKEWYEKNNMIDEYKRLKDKWVLQDHTSFKHYDKVMKLRDLCRSVCPSAAPSPRKASSPNKERSDLFNDLIDVDLDNLLFTDGADEENFYNKAEAIVKGDEECKFWINIFVYNYIEDYIKSQIESYMTIMSMDNNFSNNDFQRPKILCTIYNDDLRKYLNHIFKSHEIDDSKIIKLMRHFVKTWSSDTNPGFISRYELYRNFEGTKKILEEELNDDDLTKKILKDIDFVGYPKTQKVRSPTRETTGSPRPAGSPPELFSPGFWDNPPPVESGFLNSLGYDYNIDDNFLSPDGKRSPKGKFKASHHPNKRDGKHKKRSR